MFFFFRVLTVWVFVLVLLVCVSAQNIGNISNIGGIGSDNIGNTCGNGSTGNIATLTGTGSAEKLPNPAEYLQQLAQHFFPVFHQQHKLRYNKRVR
jgi:hypothetical protein